MAAITGTVSGQTSGRSHMGLRFAVSEGNASNSPYTLSGIATEDELLFVFAIGTGADPAVSSNQTANATISAANTVLIAKNLATTARTLLWGWVDVSI